MQGTGVTIDGKYITIVKANKKEPEKSVFKYGKGGKCASPTPWKTIAVDPKIIPLGSKVIISTYPTLVFVAQDVGGNIKNNHIDVFIGEMDIAKAFSYGEKFGADVWIIK